MEADGKSSSIVSGYQVPGGYEKKRAPNGVILVPQPTEDPEDPLNWSLWNKCTITGIWCLGAFVSTASGLGNALGYFVQAKLYHKDDPVQLSYSVVAATAGIAVGPVFAVTLGRRYGRSFVFFWSMVGLLATGIWSALMTEGNQYIPFVIARLFGGFFGGNAAALGADTILDLFFLHQRGKGLTVLNLSFLGGVVVGPTLSGFIVGNASWTIQFWWSNGLELIIILLSLAFLEDTSYDRTTKNPEQPHARPRSFWARKSAIFLYYPRIMPPVSAAESILSQKAAMLSHQLRMPNVSMLETYRVPVADRMVVLFCLWFGVAFAQLYGFWANDGIPLWICRRKGGLWQPEYRLHALWFPCFVALPIALGLYGASLQYHLHFMVLAIANFLGGFATNCMVPVTVNYIIECFKGHASEAAAIMGIYRLALSLSIPFFAPAWVERIGFGWCLGMAAILSAVVYSSVILLILRGNLIRGWSIERVASNDEGEKLIANADSVEKM
ncbi:MAG: hypothetical protein Q9222_002768 [Ikaeria aurantiellina]